MRASSEGGGAGPAEREDAPVLVLVGGARAAEGELLRRVDELLGGDRLAQRLAAPVRVVVPSLSLRAHVLRRVAAARGRGTAGLLCQTLYAVGLEIHERSGRRPPRGGELAEVLVRRFARRESALAEALGGLVDGFGAVAETVRDLLDAGFEPVHREALEEVLASEAAAEASRAEIARGLAVLRVASALAGHLEAAGCAPSAALYRDAADLLAADPAALPARAVLVHGFADATGVAGDLLHALARHRAARVVVDHPPDPAEPGRPDPGRRFTRRLRERLELAGARPSAAPDTPRPAVGGRHGDDAPRRLALFRAPGREAEARAVADRIRRLLAAGVAPEEIGVVARHLPPYRAALATHLRRAGVPFSSFAARGAPCPAARRAGAARDLLADGARVEIGRWLEALGPAAPSPPRPELAHGLAHLGLRRLGELANHRGELGDDDLRLPARRGLVRRERRGEPRVEAPRRRLPAASLRRAAEAADRLLARLRRLRREAPLGEHAATLADLLTEDLGWRAEDGDERRALEAVARLAEPPAGRVPVRRDELLLLAERAIDAALAAPFGGEGAGVQVLDAMQARGRTFEHLFVIGLVRGSFPRAPHEDPLLPDPLRRALARSGHGVLPDLPLRGEALDEERFLFAELLSAAGSLTLSWLEVDDDGRPESPSPLLARLQAGGGGEALAAPLVAPLVAVPRARDGEPSPARTAFEWCAIAGAAGRREPFAPLAALALEEGAGTRAVDPAERVGAVVAARRAVLDELDPERRSPGGARLAAAPGPYLGEIGPPPAADDPRAADLDLSITLLEGLARCPWQTLLRRLLRLEPPPDPLAGLPAIEPRRIGSLVHEALEAIAGGSGAESLDACRGAPPRRPPWPSGDELERLLVRAAGRRLAREGVRFAGLAEALAVAARPFVEQAAAADWREAGPPPVVASELSGGLTLSTLDDGDAGGGSATRRLRFRVDRVDRGAAGALMLTDYKTGRPLTDARRASTRRRHLAESVARGASLQAAAYAVAAGPGSRGRYLFLTPELADRPEAREAVVEAGDAELEASFERAARRLLAAARHGHWFPRLVAPDDDVEPLACRFCEVSEACLRGDSGVRGRLRRLGERRADEGDDADGWLAAWRLPLAEPGSGR